ncbi:MAG: hypothetical protein ABW136_08790 [Steroidobacteraceae bacterium]
MSLFRDGHDAYGAPLIDGLSWGLLPIVFWTAVVIIVLHAIVSALTAGKRRNEER